MVLFWRFAVPTQVRLVTTQTRGGFRNTGRGMEREVLDLMLRVEGLEVGVVVCELRL